VVLVGSQALIPFWLQQPEQRRSLVDDFVAYVVGGMASLVAVPAVRLDGTVS
jgi:hypothetical protein